MKYRLAATAFLFLLTLIAAPISVGAAIASPANAGPINFAAVDAYITAQMQKHGLKGASLAVTHGDQVVYLPRYPARKTISSTERASRSPAASASGRCT